MRYYQKLLLLERTGEIFYSRKDMSNQKVSVVTVCYNAVDTIEKTILSVINQTYQNIEYIIIDGGSKDGTVDVINKYRDKIAYFVSEPDKGIYDAMNKGIKAATGDWILFRNSGDMFFLNDSIEKLFLLSKRKPNTDFLLANCRFFKDWGYLDAKPSILKKNYMDGMPAFHPSTLIKREIQQKYLFNIKYKNSADYDFFIEAFNNGATYEYCDIILSLVDANVGATVDHYDRSIKENIEILKNHDASLDKIFKMRCRLIRYYTKKYLIKWLPILKVFDRNKELRLGWVETSNIVGHN